MTTATATTREQITAAWDEQARAYFDHLSVDHLASLLDNRLDPEDPGALAEVTRLMTTVGWMR